MPVVETRTFWLSSDAHCTKLGNEDYSVEQANSIPIYETFRDLANAAAPDAVFTLGDIAASPASLADASAVLTTINNHHAAIGNHDLAEAFGGETPAYWKPFIVAAYEMPSAYYAFTIGFIRCIVFDACFTTDGVTAAPRAGYIPPAQMNWLINELNGSQKATFIFGHHVMQVRYVDGAEYWFEPENLHQLIYNIQQHRNVYVFGGHKHPAANIVLSLSVGGGLGLAPLVDRDPGTGLAYTVATIELDDTDAVTVTLEEQTITLP